MNWEVVRRVWPCRAKGRGCGKCLWLHHVRVQHHHKTLCGHACLGEDQWAPLPDWHPEDVDAYDRCQVCYERMKT